MVRISCFKKKLKVLCYMRCIYFHFLNEIKIAKTTRFVHFILKILLKSIEQHTTAKDYWNQLWTSTTKIYSMKISAQVTIIHSECRFPHRNYFRMPTSSTQWLNDFSFPSRSKRFYADQTIFVYYALDSKFYLSVKMNFN